MKFYNHIKKAGVVIMASMLMLVTLNFSNTDVLAAQVISFAGDGVLVVNEDGTFTTTGGNVASGTLDETTSITAIGNLEIVLNNSSTKAISNIDASADLKVGGNGSIAFNNTSGKAVRVGGNLEVDAKLSASGQTIGIEVIGNITVNNTVLTATGIANEGVSAIGTINVNNAQVYAGGRFSAVLSESGDINVMGSAALIESTRAGTYPVRTQTGNMVVDAGKIYVPNATVDGVTVANDNAVMTVKNGGLIEAFGDNAGVGSGGVLVDNAQIIGTSNRIGVSANASLLVQNNGVINGTILDGSGGQDYGVVNWDGDTKVTSNGKITGTGEIGVLSYTGSIESSGGLIEGYGEQYGVEAVGNVYANNGGRITGDATNQVATARGVGSRANMSADNGTIVGHAIYRAVYAFGTMSADNVGYIQGNADIRADSMAAVSASTVTANNGSTILENYLGPVTNISDEAINPYFSSRNMTSFSNFDWTTTSGKVKKTADGIIATESSASAIISAKRTYEAGVSEVVVLGSTGNNQHIIQLPVSLQAKDAPNPQPKPEPKPEPKPVVKPSMKPSVKPSTGTTTTVVEETVLIGTKSGLATGDNTKLEVYAGMLVLAFATTVYMKLRTKKKVKN